MEGYDVCRLRIEFEGEEIPWMYPLALNGRTINGVFVNDEEYLAESDWRFVEITAEHVDCEQGKVITRYERVRECAPTIEPWGSDTAKFDAYCGNCGCEIGDELMRLPNYCHRCGARVKGGRR